MFYFLLCFLLIYNTIYIRRFEAHSFYWADDASEVNKIAVGLWSEHTNTGRYLDMKDNLDGRKTKPGELYESYAVIGGSTSLRLFVSKVDSDLAWNLKVNDIKAILVSCGLSKKGAQQILKGRLEDYLKQEEDLVAAAAAATAAVDQAAAAQIAVLPIDSGSTDATTATTTDLTTTASALQDAASYVNTAGGGVAVKEQVLKRDSGLAFNDGNNNAQNKRPHKSAATTVTETHGTTGTAEAAADATTL